MSDAPNAAVFVKSEAIAKAKVYDGNINSDTAFIAYEPSWILNLPVSEPRVDRYITGKLEDKPNVFYLDLYTFVMFKTMDECAKCLEECGYKLKPLKYEDVYDEEVDQQDEHDKQVKIDLENCKMFESNGDSPIALIDKICSTSFEPILKIEASDIDSCNQFGIFRTTRPVSIMKMYQQNIGGVESSDDYSSDAERSLTPRMTKNDFTVMFALKSIGVDYLDDFIEHVRKHPKWVKSVANEANNDLEAWQYLAENKICRVKIAIPEMKSQKLSIRKRFSPY